MNRIVHKLLYYRKKIGLALVVLALSSWLVYTGNARPEYFEQPKIVKFYPNPATSFINFEFPNDNNSSYILQVYSFTGKKMTEQPVSGTKLTLTLGNAYYRGLYIFHLTDKSGKLIEAGKFQVVK